MLLNTYAHILDKDRKVNAQKFESSFYGKKDNEELVKEINSDNEDSDLLEVMSELEKSPELVKTLKLFISKKGLVRKTLFFC